MRFIILTCLFLTIKLVADPKIQIAVGDGNQKPFLLRDGKGLSKLTLDLFNRIQGKYHFEYFSLPTKRMRVLAKEGKLDLIAFDNPAWGWAKDKVVSSQALLRNKDVFISLKDKYSDDIFAKIGQVNMITVNGFHYNFAAYKNSKEVVDKFQLIPTVNENHVLSMVLANRAPLGIISTSFLNYVKVSNPNMYRRIRIAKKEDQSYKRYFNVVKGSKISVEDLNEIIDLAIITNQLPQLFAEFGLEDDFQDRLK